nr:hypothetical protein HK105_006659 [Polyrhizophydium stewartii]
MRQAPDAVGPIVAPQPSTSKICVWLPEKAATPASPKVPSAAMQPALALAATVCLPSVAAIDVVQLWTPSDGNILAQEVEYVLPVANKSEPDICASWSTGGSMLASIVKGMYEDTVTLKDCKTPDCSGRCGGPWASTNSSNKILNMRATYLTQNRTLTASEFQALTPLNPSASSYFRHTEYSKAELAFGGIPVAARIAYVRPMCTAGKDGYYFKSQVSNGQIVTRRYKDSSCSGKADNDVATFSGDMFPADAPGGSGACIKGAINSPVLGIKLSEAASAGHQSSLAAAAVAIVALVTAAGVAFF